MILYYCSNGDRIRESAIRLRYTAAIKLKHIGYTVFTCQGCLKAQAVHNDHTIAKARCKILHKTELIWDPRNFEDSCAKCHASWENFKSGEWTLHHNVERRLAFMKEHDPEGYRKRIELTEWALQNTQ